VKRGPSREDTQKGVKAKRRGKQVLEESCTRLPKGEGYSREQE